MKELNSNLSRKLLTKSKEDERRYSIEQAKIIQQLADESGLTFKNVSDFLGSIGSFVRVHMKKGDIVHLQKFAKFIPHENKKNGKESTDDQDRIEEDTAEV